MTGQHCSDFPELEKKLSRDENVYLWSLRLPLTGQRRGPFSRAYPIGHGRPECKSPSLPTGVFWYPIFKLRDIIWINTCENITNLFFFFKHGSCSEVPKLFLKNLKNLPLTTRWRQCCQTINKQVSPSNHCSGSSFMQVHSPWTYAAPHYNRKMSLFRQLPPPCPNHKEPSPVHGVDGVCHTGKVFNSSFTTSIQFVRFSSNLRYVQRTTSSPLFGPKPSTESFCTTEKLRLRFDSSQL